MVRAEHFVSPVIAAWRSLGASEHMTQAPEPKPAGPDPAPSAPEAPAPEPAASGPAAAAFVAILVVVAYAVRTAIKYNGLLSTDPWRSAYYIGEAILFPLVSLFRQLLVRHDVLVCLGDLKK